MSDSDDDRTQINMRVSSSKKEEWDNALAENETLTGLIRRSVDKELNDEYVHVSAIESISDDSTSQKTESLESDIEDLKSTINVLSAKIDTLNTPTGQKSKDVDEDDIEDLALRLIDELPSHPQDVPRDAVDIINDMDDRDAARTLIEYSRKTDEKTLDGRPERFAGLLDAPVWSVREALNHLEYNTTERVVSVSMSDSRHWFRFR